MNQEQVTNLLGKIGDNDAIFRKCLRSFTVDDYQFEEEETIGGEGKGDDYEFIFSIKDPKNDEKTFVSICGFYSSEWGVEFDGDEFTIVEKKEVMVEKWVAV